ncbi:MAG: hypothetical protein LBR12_02090 [Opitutaceae bacterium]|jgi:outer membrane protein assembly factor BamE (lipoprotein component of BamABCDE complex)|nr:hypothetical protein [Opitutaceae bacterium]
MKRNLALLLCAAAALLLLGCSSVEQRIEANRELFNSLTPAQRDLIAAGRVAVGFTTDMVLLALGQPDKTWSRTDASGSGETWSYTTWETRGGVALYSGWWHRGWWQPYRGALYYLDFPDRRERDRVRVVFRDGKVVEIEERK